MIERPVVEIDQEKCDRLRAVRARLRRRVRSR